MAYGALVGSSFPGQQRILSNGLGCVLGVNARAAQEQELVHTSPSAPFDDVGLDGQVVVQKVRGLGAVGVDATHLGGGQIHLGGAGGGQKIVHGPLVTKVQFCGGPNHDVAMARCSRNARTKADPTMPVWPAT